MHNLAKSRCSTAAIFILIAAGIPGLLKAETTSNDWFSVVSILKHKQALNRAHDVELSGNLAFVPGKGGSIAIIDIAKPNAPKLLWHKEGLGDSETVLPIGNHLLLGTLAGKIAFFAGGETVEAVDISDPMHPVKLGSQKLPASNMNPDASYAKGKRKTDNAHDLIYRDGYLYVSCQSDDSFMILRINDGRILSLAKSH